MAYDIIGIINFYTLPFLLFLLGAWGIIVLRRNIIMLLISIELMLLGVNLALIFTSIFLDDLSGQIFSLFILIVAGGESAIGLAILVSFYRLQGIISMNYISFLKG